MTAKNIRAKTINFIKSQSVFNRKDLLSHLKIAEGTGESTTVSKFMKDLVSWGFLLPEKRGSQTFYYTNFKIY